MSDLSPTAVRVILACLLNDREAFHRWWSEVGPGFWTDPYYNAIATFVDDFFQKHGKPPAGETIFDFFQNDPDLDEEDRDVIFSVLSDLAESSVEDWAHYQINLRSYVRQRAFTVALEDAEGLLETKDYDGILEAFNKANAAGLTVDRGTVGYFGPESIEVRFDRRTKADMVPRIGTRIGDTDRHIKSGLAPGTLTVFIGATGGGKTTCMVHLGRMAVLQGFKVLHLTLELSSDDVTDRYDCAFSGLKLEDLEANAGKLRAKFLSKFSAYGDSLRVMEFPEYSLSPSDLSSLLILMKQQADFVPDMILVDYADLMTGGKGSHFKASDKRHELGFIYTSLHRIAKEHNVVMVTASQANRAAMSKKLITLEDIAEDISKTFIADHVICICQSKKERLVGKCRLFLAKNRSGHSLVEIEFDQDLSTCTFALPGRSSMSRIIDPDELDAEE